MGENTKVNVSFKFKNIRVIVIVLIMTFGIGMVMFQLYDIQIRRFEQYQSSAIDQQTSETKITPKRGTIYDRNMKVLATSTSVERVFISPAELTILPKKTDSENKEEYEPDEQTEKARNEKAAKLTAQGLSEILGVDYDFIYEQTQIKNKKDRTIKQKVDRITANEVRQFALDNRIKGIYFQADTKRIYPFSNLASNIIGFTGSENTGSIGIERKYDEYLKGVAGRIVTAKDGLGNTMSSEYETYIDAQNGKNLVLTIDWTIQNFLEKHLEVAFADTLPRQRITGIIMDVNTGEILAMSTKPDFDLNNPYDISPDVLQYINLDAKTLEAIDKQEFESEEAKQEEIIKQQIFKLWNNKAITETYEPGSTFKVITSAMALEEKAVKENDGFYCGGSYTVGGVNISCHLKGGHGQLSFREGLQQSCNPVIMQSAEKIGGETFLKYFGAFGYREKTGIDLPGEAGSITHSPDNFRSVELATASFGQRFKVTPIQQIVGIATVANGGKLIVPHLVKAIIDDDGNVVQNFQPEVKRTIISEETSKAIAQIMADGVSGGAAARNANVKGYSIAAKTGTSEKRDVSDSARIGSCVAFAPADNPRIAILILIDEPDLTISSMYGGVIAAPVVSKVLAETLPYLGIEPNFSEKEIAETQVIVKDYVMQKISYATEDITSRGLTYTIEGDGEFIRNQIPKKGSSLPKGGNVILYTDNSQNQNIDIITVPDVMNMTVESANRKIIDAGLNINIIGAENMQSSAGVYKQYPAAGEQVPRGTIVTVEFRHIDEVW